MICYFSFAIALSLQIVAMDDGSETSDGLGATSLVPARVRSLLIPTPKSRVGESANMSRHDWNTVVMNAFASSHSVHSTLSYPWERGTVSGVFSDRLLPSLPSAAPSIGYDLSAEVVDPFAMSVDDTHFHSMDGLHFTAFVKNIPDQEYFEAKQARIWNWLVADGWFCCNSVHLHQQQALNFCGTCIMTIQVWQPKKRCELCLVQNLPIQF